MHKILSYKPILILLLVLNCQFSIVNSLSAQEEPGARYPYRREIQNGDFVKAAQKLGKKLAKDSLDVSVNYAVYRLLSADGSPDRDLPRAHRHLSIAHKAYCHASPKELDRLTRDGFDGALFTADLQRIGLLALADARMASTADAYSSLLATFTGLPDSILTLATYSRDSIELATARQAGRTVDFADFLQRRPASPLLALAVALRDSAAFADAQRLHTPEGYEQFLHDYPLSAEYRQAADSLYTLAFRQATEANAEQFYRAYAERYPESPYAPVSLFRADSIEYHSFVRPGDWRSYVAYLDHDAKGGASWKTLALHTLCDLVLADRAVEPVAQALAHTSATDAYYLPLATRLRMAYMMPSVTNYHRLYDNYRHLLPEAWRHNDSLALDCYRGYRFDIVDSCIRAIAPYHEAYIMLQQLIDHDLRYGRTAEALAAIEPYRGVFDGSEDYAKLYETLQRPASSSSNSQFSILNSQFGDCSYPVPTADGKTLYFSVKGHSSNIGGADIFSASVKNNKGIKISNPHIEIDLSHTYGNEAPLSVTADGNTMLSLQSGRYFLARRDSASRYWLPAEPLLPDFPLPIADACLTADGRAVILSVPGKEDYQTDTSLNLYILLLDSGRDLIDLGPVVNTPFAERAPYLHSDMKRLYFASEGHGSLGQMDLYVVERLSDDRWDLWSEPRNLGVGINTVENETWIRLAPDGKTAYSHRRGRQMEIVTFQLP